VVLAYPNGLLRHSLAALLEHEGHRVVSLEEAYVRRGTWREAPDLAIIGPEFIAGLMGLRAQHPLLPIIAIGLPEEASIGATIALPRHCEVADFREAVRWSLCASGASDRVRATADVRRASTDC
jgi:hypothetical protein